MFFAHHLGCNDTAEPDHVPNEVNDRIIPWQDHSMTEIENIF